MSDILISGDDLPSNSPVKAKWIGNFGNTGWRFLRGYNGNTFMRPTERGFIVYALIYSPDRNLDSDSYFNQRELNPLSGITEQIGMYLDYPSLF